MILLALATIPVVILGIFELAARQVYGRFLPDSEVLPFIERNRNKYISNGANDGLIYGLSIPFIAKSPFDPFSKWYINDVGRISRWSMASKMVDELHAKAYREPVAPKLSDF